MKILAVFLALMPMLAAAQVLKPVKKSELATVLGFLEELATTSPASDQPYFIRVYSVPTRISDCGGPVSSCPDVRLFITVSNGDQEEAPVLYQLPLQKGWEFKSWGKPVQGASGQMASFIVRTTLPEANIDPAGRKGWRSIEYRVLVSPESASYSRH